MGESMVDSLIADKMAETASSNPALEVSVSFGRFDNDALSWEKWSSFSPNKYLEEVEKCATPGSVAQKKAYFEAHYKKIAAKKAELLDQEKQMDGGSPLSSHELSVGDLIENNGSTDTESGLSEDRNSSQVVEQEMKLDGELSTDEINETGQEIKLDGEIANHVGEITEDVMITKECQSLPVEEVKEETNGIVDIRKCIESEIVTEEKEKETTSLVSQPLKEMHKFEKEVEKTVNVETEKIKAQHSKEPHKVTPASKEKYMARIKKKPVSPMPKPQFSSPSAPRTHFSTLSAPKTQLYTPCVSKPAPTSLTMSMSRPSTVKGNNSSLFLRRKNPTFGESKKVAPKSMHMSLSLGSPNSDPPNSDSPSLMTTRKSFIMEQMGDKEIVKRAFKSFQNHYNQLKSSSEQKTAIPIQVPFKATQLRVNASGTPRRENGGIFKAAVMDKKNAKSAPSSFGVKNDDKIEKRREFSKTLGEKSNAVAKDARKTRLQAISKEIIKQADIKQPKQTLNTKVTSMSGVHRGLKVSRNPSDKGISKN
jgi:hypothetical protein